MTKSQKIILFSSIIVSFLSLLLSILALHWVNTNNKRDIATELLLSAKIKCLETKDSKDCQKAQEYLKDLRDKSINFEF